MSDDSPKIVSRPPSDHWVAPYLRSLNRLENQVQICLRNSVKSKSTGHLRFRRKIATVNALIVLGNPEQVRDATVDWKGSYVPFLNRADH
jgi:hypothetical protein